ncbi:Ig-like domain-containing protein [Candidatus Palauibacter sp.]|uniref:Ig-like domain-containing protein n=1 Tax=Candidatus Palauibacter sp. TaxID=3101350 RepID=UPI003B52DF41
MRYKHLVLLGAAAVLAQGCKSEFVTPPPPPPPLGPAYVTVSPATASLTVRGDTAQFTGAVFTRVGNEIEYRSGFITWTSSAATVATVNGAGLVTAVGNGTATITAAVTMDPHLRDTATVTVSISP